MIATSGVSLPPTGLSVQAASNLRVEKNDPCESKWKTTNPVPLTRKSFLDLLYGRTPLVKEAQFITPDQTQRLYNHLEPLFSPYLHATGPPVSKVGVAQFEFQAQSAEDFKNRAGDGELNHFFQIEHPAYTPRTKTENSLKC